MANYTAQDVKKLREDTDAPMMECKAALEEADGDFEKAKSLLREKGKAAAAKRTDRTTAAGVVAFAANEDATVVGGVVLECETDFVARNEDFVALAQQIAEIYRDTEAVDPEKIKEITDGAVAKIRENIKVTSSVRLTSSNPISTYVHHDRTKGAAVVSEGEANDAVRKVAIQIVAFPPEVLKKEDLTGEAGCGDRNRDSARHQRGQGREPCSKHRQGSRKQRVHQASSPVGAAVLCGCSQERGSVPS